MTQQAQLDSMVVKRIQEACASERPGRAMDLASLLSLEKSFQIAIKVGHGRGQGIDRATFRLRESRGPRASRGTPIGPAGRFGELRRRDTSRRNAD